VIYAENRAQISGGYLIKKQDWQAHVKDQPVGSPDKICIDELDLPDKPAQEEN